MATDDKVISLEQRRSSGPAKRRGARVDEAARAGDGAQRRATPAASDDPTPVPGRLIWLYCPTCHSIEYTEVDMAGGRVHNTCGTQVQEAPVELDLRSEATIAAINLERLDILQSLLDGQRRRFDEYLRRLSLAAGRPLAPYALGEQGADSLPVAEVDAFGLLVSRFFADPARLFPELAQAPAGAEPQAGAEPPAGAVPPAAGPPGGAHED